MSERRGEDGTSARPQHTQGLVGPEALQTATEDSWLLGIARELNEWLSFSYGADERVTYSAQQP